MYCLCKVLHKLAKNSTQREWFKCNFDLINSPMQSTTIQPTPCPLRMKSLPLSTLGLVPLLIATQKYFVVPQESKKLSLTWKRNITDHDCSLQTIKIYWWRQLLLLSTYVRDHTCLHPNILTRYHEFKCFPWKKDSGV